MSTSRLPVEYRSCAPDAPLACSHGVLAVLPAQSYLTHDADHSLRVVSTICQRAIDWLWIDCEHGWAASVEGTGAACVLARSLGVAPVIRVAWNDPALIKKALDMGAVGVMVPQVQNATEAKAAVDAARYYPDGMRGISPPWTALAGMGMDSAVLKKIQEETVVMVQLESEESYKNLKEIAAVPGVRC